MERSRGERGPPGRVTEAAGSLLASGPGPGDDYDDDDDNPAGGGGGNIDPDDDEGYDDDDEDDDEETLQVRPAAVRVARGWESSSRRTISW